MELELIKQKELPLLSRKRVSLWLKEGGATPSRADLIKAIAKKFKTKEDMIIIKHIYPQFGNSQAKVIAHLYDNKEKMTFFEHESLLKKHVVKEPKAEDKTENAPAEKKEDKPKEEKKEEPKQEKKAEEKSEKKEEGN